MTDDRRPQLQAPPGACDCHVHFYGSEEVYPVASTALFLPPPATVTDYRRVQERLGLERVVVVQPTSYGKDNRCTMEAVRELGPEVARAVVVVDRQTPDEELQRLTDLGARGIRFHMLSGGALPWDVVEPLAHRVQAFGWHSQLQFDGRELPERMAMIERLPGTLVIDHTGKFLEPVRTGDEAFQCLLRLVGSGRAWVKLSAPYETSEVGTPAYDDVSALARALVEAAPERMLWASNWPHPGRTDENRPDEADLLDLLMDWTPDEATARRILVDNPAVLYGF